MSNNYQNSDNKPTAAFILSLLSGIFVLLGALVSVMFASIFAAIGFFSGITAGFAIIGLVWSILILLGSVLLYVKPANHQAWGALILISSLLSILGAWAGFGIGLILGLIGGILGIVFKPASLASPNITINNNPTGYPSNSPSQQQKWQNNNQQ